MKPMRTITFVLLIAGSSSAANLFTVNIPLEFQGINPAMSHVSVTCQLEQSLNDRQRSGSIIAPHQKSVLIPLIQHSGAPGPDGVVAPGKFAGGNYIGPATIVFTDLDLGTSRPTSFGSVLCWFALRGTDGTMHSAPIAPGGDPMSNQLSGYLPLPQPEWVVPSLRAYKPTQFPGAPYLYRWQSELLIGDGPVSP